MTKRDLFAMLIKLFGLYCVIITIFSAVPANIAYAFWAFDLMSILWMALVAMVIIGLFVLLIFKTGRVIHLLQLDKGFDDERVVLGDLTPAKVLKLGTFIIGGLLFLNHIPRLLIYTFSAMKGHVNGQPLDATDNFQWTISVLNVILGYLLLTNFNWIARQFERIDNK